MIQRIQTVYYIISMFFLGILLSGMDLLRFVTTGSYYSFNVHGITQHFTDSKLAVTQTKSHHHYITFQVSSECRMWVTVGSFPKCGCFQFTSKYTIYFPKFPSIITPALSVPEKLSLTQQSSMH